MGRRVKESPDGGLLGRKLKVINIGIETFAQDLEKQGVEVIRIDWRPAAGVDSKVLRILEKLGS